MAVKMATIGIRPVLHVFADHDWRRPRMQTFLNVEKVCFLSFLTQYDSIWTGQGVSRSENERCHPAQDDATHFSSFEWRWPICHFLNVGGDATKGVKHLPVCTSRFDSTVFSRDCTTTRLQEGEGWVGGKKPNLNSLLSVAGGWPRHTNAGFWR